MKADAGSIRDALVSEGIELVGIADTRDLFLSYPPRPATDLMPTARSVIVMAVAHNLAAVQAPYLKIWTRNKMQTSRALDCAAEKLARQLENDGYLALPVSADKPVEIYKRDPVSGAKLRHPRVAGHLSLKHAAVSAGLGEIGRSNLLLTEEFGPHQRLGAIVTELELEPATPREPSLCDECGRCEKACPVGALSGGAHDVDVCFNYWTYGLELMPPRHPGDIPGYIRMMLRNLRERAPLIESGQTFITDVDFCIECMKACPVGSRWKQLRG